jgi:hypothetical protein
MISSTLPQPVPKNLREQMLKRIASMDENSLLLLHDLELLTEAVRLREVMSEQAEAERAAGKWEGIEEVVRAYRRRNTQE